MLGLQGLRQRLFVRLRLHRRTNLPFGPLMHFLPPKVRDLPLTGFLHCDSLRCWLFLIAFSLRALLLAAAAA